MPHNKTHRRAALLQTVVFQRSELIDSRHGQQGSLKVGAGNEWIHVRNSEMNDHTKDHPYEQITRDAQADKPYPMSSITDHHVEEADQWKRGGKHHRDRHQRPAERERENWKDARACVVEVLTIGGAAPEPEDSP